MRALLIVSFSVALLAGSCGSSNDEATPTTTTMPASTTTSTSTTTTTVAPTTAAPTTAAPTTVPATTTEPATTTTTVSTTTTTTEALDTEAPSAPVNVTCSTGGGSQEVQLEWDAPADPSDVVDVRLYVDEGSGFVRLEKFTVASGRVMTGPTRWSAVAYPVPVATSVQMAVTVGDAAGNESGWNPIDVYYEFSGAECVS